MLISLTACIIVSASQQSLNTLVSLIDPNDDSVDMLIHLRSYCRLRLFNEDETIVNLKNGAVDITGKYLHINSLDY